MSPCTVIVSASHLNQGCESGPLMEIIGIATVSSPCRPGPLGSMHNAQGAHVTSRDVIVSLLFYLCYLLIPLFLSCNT